MKEKVFSAEELSLLKRIASALIPASEEGGLPAADDEVIFQCVLENPAEQLIQLQSLLFELIKQEGGAAVVTAWDRTHFDNWIADYEKQWPKQVHSFFKVYIAMLLRAYYQDARVLIAYDRRPGPPFPEGYVVIEGDWSLLDAVKNRKPFYRR
ncbi:MAG: hypothetical protein OXU66_00655 [Gammaproteobacteria bacterium]|nr:hypothetical protein [Gammaproteobacteria bacterium]MDD9894223.1 hypothetical protein [Gammaproteobacteria bacterium]MDD9957424.1 hypothetical protein [Gammaproteobacteria bacterium]